MKNPAAVFLAIVATVLLLASHPFPSYAQQPVALPTPTPRATESGIPTATPEPSTPLLADAIASAIVRIVSIGEQRRIFDSVDARSLGTGSGFVIDERGIIATNAHVVNSGDEFEVYFPGESESLSAALLASDECADIALLALNGAEGPLTALAWRSEAAQQGEAVIAAGYPGGIGELQTTRGVVRQTGLRSFTDWASVGSVIDHTASVEPGNSGGPLLDSAGNVVGVVYARGSDAGDAAAISSEDARAVIDALLAGEEGYRTGITAQAFNAANDQYGVWVISVAPDSFAENAGVLPGDIIRRMNGRVVGRDGTLARYCQVVRESAVGGTISLEVYRSDTNEVLAGALNGAPLAPLRALTTAVYPTPTPAPTPNAVPLAPVVDETGSLVVNAPGDWLYQLNDSVGFGSIISARIFGIAPSAEQYETGRALLRVVVGEIAGLVPEEILDETRNNLYCTTFERSDYADAAWEGIVDRCTGARDPSYVNAFLRNLDHPALFANVNFFVSESNYPMDLGEVIAPLADGLAPNLPVAQRPSAVVQVDALNVRSGPGLDFAPITQVYRGESLPIAGKNAEGCEWLFVAYSNLAGWVAGAPQYVALDRPCGGLVVLTAQEIEAWQSGVE